MNPSTRDQPILGWGIVGCGDVVFRKSGPSILASPDSRIVGVMRRDPDKARPFADAHGIPLCTADAHELIHHPEVGLVYVATPPSSHREYVLAAAAAGKHVLVEKPMGLSTAEDQRMIEACQNAGVQLFVSYYRRFHPHIRRIKQLLEEGTIGNPVWARVDYAQAPRPGHDWGWRVRPDISGGGLALDILSHRIDLLNYLLGKPLTAHGQTTPERIASGEESTLLVIPYAGGALATVSGDFLTGRNEDRLVIHATRGSLVVETLDQCRLVMHKDGRVEEFAFDRPPAPHSGLVRHIEAVLAGRETNSSSGKDALQTDHIWDIGIRRADK